MVAARRAQNGGGAPHEAEDFARAPPGFRTLPCNVEAEAALLGTIMLEPRALAQIRFLRPEHFYEPVYGQIFERMGELLKTSRPIDPVALYRAFVDDAGLKKLPGGARAHLGAMARAAETVIDPVEHAREIFDLSLKRSIIKAAEEAINRAYDPTLAETGLNLLTDHAQIVESIGRTFSTDSHFGFITHNDLEEDFPLRPFLVDRWIPRGCVTSLYGAGGTGKSFLAMMLGMSVAAGRPWLGYPCQQSTVLGIMCEDDDDELKRRRNKIARSLGIKREELDGRLFLTARVGLNNILMEFPQGIGRRTELFEQVIAEAMRINAGLVILDNAAQLFGGNEVDRAQVTAFMNAAANIAREIDGAVLLLGHPPKHIGTSGKNEGAKWSGSTAWDAVTRARIWFTRLEEDDEEPDPASPARYMLELAKANYARRFAVELVENAHGVVEFVGEVDPKQNSSRGRSRHTHEATLDVLRDLYTTHRRAIALDEIVKDCIRLGIVREAKPDTAAWRDRRRSIKMHLAKHQREVDYRDEDFFAIRP